MNSPATDELMAAVLALRSNAYRDALLDYNAALRSAFQVAKRAGMETNWEALSAELELILKKHHETWIEARADARESE